MVVQNVEFTLRSTMELAQKKFDAITANNWTKVCAHVDKVVEEIMDKEHCIDAATEMKFMVNAGDPDFENEECTASEDEENSDDVRCSSIEWN